MQARSVSLGSSEQGLFLLQVRISDRRLPWTGQRRWAILPGFDIHREVGDNHQRQGCHPSGHTEDLVEVLPLLVDAPMSGVVFMQRAITLLTFGTKQVHCWPRGPGRVINTSSPGGAVPRPVGVQRWRRDATH